MTPGEPAVHRDGQSTLYSLGVRPTFPRTALTRTLWKELRTLRPLAVAMFVLTVFVLLAPKLFLGRFLPVDAAALGGWFATALYAVGAAATVLSGERDDETDVFYHVVAAPPRIVFAAKLLAATVTSLALVAALLGAAMLLGVSDAPLADAANSALLGAPILLAAGAWGFLTATVIRQPLLAALAGIALGSLSYQIPLAILGSAGQVFELATMRCTTPAFVAMSLAVLAVAWLLGKRWALPHAEKSRRRAGHWRAASAKYQETLAAVPNGDTPVARAGRKAMLARLLWQTWRTSRRPMLAAIGIGLALVPAIELPLYLARLSSPAIPDLPVSALFIPALLGALVFRADHRHASYQFLDQKAARPRLVWGVRQAVWLTTTVLLASVLLGAALWFFYDRLADRLPLLVSGWEGQYRDRETLALEFVQGRRLFATIVGHASWAILLAYAWGQLCSLVVRREVLAGFLAVLGSIVVTAWAIGLGLADLGAVQFMGLATVGLLAISWWLAPGYLAERESLVEWSKLAAAVVAVAGGMLAMIPGARMAQVAASPSYAYLTESPSALLAKAKKNRGPGRKVALRYEQARNAIIPYNEAIDAAGLGEIVGAKLVAGIELDKVGVDLNSVSGELASPVSSRESGSATDKQRKLLTAIDEAELLLDAAYSAENQEAIAEALKASEESRCWFEGEQYVDKMGLLTQLIFDDAERLLNAARDSETPAKNLDAAWRRIVALVRIRAHILQSSPLYSGPWEVEPYFQSFAHLSGLIARWSTADGQTPERLRTAALDLLACEFIYPTLADRLLINYEGLLKVIDGTEPPAWLRERSNRYTARGRLRNSEQRAPLTWNEHLALALHELPWEHRRARRAAELIAADRLDFAEGLSQGRIPPRSLANAAWPRADHPTTMAWDEDRRGAVAWVAQRQQALDRARTCWLVANEERVRESDLGRATREFINAQARRRGEVLRLALVAYRLEHDEYPKALRDALDELAGLPLKTDPHSSGQQLVRPELLSTLLADPYSGKPFGYVRELADGPLYVTEPYFWNGKTIEHGPLLWSVGVSDVRLVHIEQAPPSEPPRSRYDIPETRQDLGPGYIFQPAADAYGSIPIVVDLPK